MKLLKEGCSIESALGRTIDDLIDQGAADRLLLGEQLLHAGEKLLRTRPPMYRAAVGRFYYAMYHSLRAVVYYDTKGDDYEGHSELPKHIPASYPNCASVTNDLKDARLMRNEADYDPYPSSDAAFKDAAKALQTLSISTIATSRAYLKNMGCQYA